MQGADGVGVGEVELLELDGGAVRGAPGVLYGGVREVDADGAGEAGGQVAGLGAVAAAEVDDRPAGVGVGQEQFAVRCRAQ